jgi:hypothetical protein
MIDLSKLSDDEVSKLDAKETIQKPKEKLTSWSKEPSLEDLKLDYQNTQSSHNEFIANIDRWEKLYDAPKIDNGYHKGSRIVPKLVRKQAEWRCPALSEPFLSTQQLYEVKPMTFEDVSRAKQNALILNMQFNTQLNKVTLVDKVVRAVVKKGTAVVRLGWEFKEEEVEVPVAQFEYSVTLFNCVLNCILRIKAFCLARDTSSNVIGLTSYNCCVDRNGSLNAGQRHSACLRTSFGTIRLPL